MRSHESVREQARRHVTEAKTRVAAHKELIAKLQRAGGDTVLAQSLLSTFEELLSGMRCHLQEEEQRARSQSEARGGTSIHDALLDCFHLGCLPTLPR